MSTKTDIAWTDATWNPLRGCTKVSAGCTNCYAEKVAARFSGPGQPYEGLATRGPARWTGEVRLIEKHLADPMRWQKPRRVFVNSMSDLFHEKVSDEDLDRIFAVMALSPQHQFQVLTKRPERMLAYTKAALAGQRDLTSRVAEFTGKHFLRANDDVMVAYGVADATDPRSTTHWKDAKPLPNVWLGVSVEDQASADERVPLLLQTPAAKRFVSAEPLLGPLDLRHLQPGEPPTEIDALAGTHGVVRPHRGDGPSLDWVIAGGESGPGARGCDIAWIRTLVSQCQEAGVACFVKQLGANPTNKDAQGFDWFAYAETEHPKGGDPAEWPEDLRVQEFPS